jgi:ribosome maturation factor RimP
VASQGVCLETSKAIQENIGRTLIVKTNAEIEAELVDANDDFVILSWQSKSQVRGKRQSKELQLPLMEILKKQLLI